MIAIIDYGMGNLRSVAKALEHLGHSAEITRDPDAIAGAQRLILPGVGAFGAAMDNLRKFELVEVLRDAGGSGKPFLGICLGMQLLLEQSEEKGVHEGLSLIPGKVTRFAQDYPANHDTPPLKIPHMGWNRIAQSSLPLIPADASFYFVHSYYVQPHDESLIAATSDHGGLFTAAVHTGPILLTQFHPEKSGDTGLALLDRWVTRPDESKRTGGAYR